MGIAKRQRGGIAKRQSGGGGYQRTSDRLRASTGTTINHYTSDWSAIRERILQRDNHTCCRCGASRKPGEYNDVVLHVDHKIPVAQGGRTVDYNLQTLCSDCHANKPGKRNKRAKNLILSAARNTRRLRNDSRNKS